MNSASEKQCPACDAIIAKTADVCPECGSAQNVPPIAKPSGTSKVLKGCLIAVAVVFVGVFVLGIVAAIVIPKFAGTKQKAYIAEMKTDLRNLSTAEAAYYQQHRTYQSNIAELAGFTWSYGVSPVRPIEADSSGWTATVKREETPMQCTMQGGTRASDTGADATPTCSVAAPAGGVDRQR